MPKTKHIIVNPKLVKWCCGKIIHSRQTEYEVFFTLLNVKGRLQMTFSLLFQFYMKVGENILHSNSCGKIQLYPIFYSFSHLANYCVNVEDRLMAVTVGTLNKQIDHILNTKTIKMNIPYVVNFISTCMDKLTSCARINLFWKFLIKQLFVEVSVCSGISFISTLNPFLTCAQ